MMEKKKRRSWHNIIAMAFAFAMVLVFAGLVGKMDANAETVTYTVTVKDTKNNYVNTTKETDKVYLELWGPCDDAVSGKTVYGKKAVIENGQMSQDGIYTFTFDRTGYDSSYIICPAAEIDGYSDYSIVTLSTNEDKIVTDSNGTKYIQSSRITYQAYDGIYAKDLFPWDLEGYNYNFTIQMTSLPNSQKILNAKTAANNEISDYINRNTYESEELSKIATITKEFEDNLDSIDALIDDTENDNADYVNEQIALIQDYVDKAKKAIDALATSQEITNNTYINDIYFLCEDGTRRDFAMIDTRGNYQITLSYFEKGGKFHVDGVDDANVTWTATKKAHFGVIEGDLTMIDSLSDAKGVFLRQSYLNGLNSQDYALGLVNDCSAEFIKDGKNIKVTFALNVIPRRINGISVQNPDEVVLTRDGKTLDYNVKVTPGNGDGQYLVKVLSDDPGYTQDITIESLNPDIAEIITDENDGKIIVPKKAGTAEFKVSSADCDDETFEINFVLSDEEKQEIKDAEIVEQMIANLGDITLAKESDVQAAKVAYNELSDNAKKRVSQNSLSALTAAENKIAALKEAKANEDAKKAAEEAAKAEALKKAQEAEALKKAEEAAKAEALKKAQEAASATTEAPAAAPTVKLSKITLKAKAGKGKVKLTWKKSSKADGYIIYRATKKNGKYKQIKVIKSWKKTSFTDKKVKSKKTYYYKICPYKGTVNGPVSAAKKAKVK